MRYPLTTEKSSHSFGTCAHLKAAHTHTVLKLRCSTRCVACVLPVLPPGRDWWCHRHSLKNIWIVYISRWCCFLYNIGLTICFRTVRSLKSMAKLMKLGKQRPPPEDEPLLPGSSENIDREHGKLGSPGNVVNQIWYVKPIEDHICTKYCDSNILVRIRLWSWDTFVLTNKNREFPWGLSRLSTQRLMTNTIETIAMKVTNLYKFNAGNVVNHL